ncbi:MAG TPA: hypothetical protein VJJ98_09165 [Sedimentisphaerales bacterium]|nr:hypothetical protein [Sedimentisphaerales bacterium]
MTTQKAETIIVADGNIVHQFDRPILKQPFDKAVFHRVALPDRLEKDVAEYKRLGVRVPAVYPPCLQGAADAQAPGNREKKLASGRSWSIIAGRLFGNR